MTWKVFFSQSIGKSSILAFIVQHLAREWDKRKESVFSFLSVFSNACFSLIAVHFLSLSCNYSSIAQAKREATWLDTRTRKQSKHQEDQALYIHCSVPVCSVNSTIADSIIIFIIWSLLPILFSSVGVHSPGECICWLLFLVSLHICNGVCIV